MSADDPMQIEYEDFGGKGRYLYRLDAHEAELTFTKAGTGKIIIDHTEVPKVFRGRGVGEALVTHAVADARKKGVKIIPLCPFTASVFRKHPEWQDVLAD
ncbi:GNAT family N-acetyltransferase [Chelativorans sp. Marseille-P2723]|uniref:GNAT family N-acetyltransferase n=1 Tax=Chelativorans sp. Marseille-P2723 TaxID=2709133 RepID=UPI001FEFE270|nr:GNAT family N-acetyltransferase [Chelativorans sp. Marseille-P2723]